MNKLKSKIPLLGLLWGGTSASLVVYLLPLIIASQILRVAIFDFIFVTFFLLVVYYSRINMKSYLPILLFLLLFLNVIFLIVNGYGYSGYTLLDTLREVRFFLFYTFNLILFYFIFQNPGGFSNKILIFSLLGVFIGNVFYFTLTKYLFHDYSYFYLSEKEYSTDYVKAFTLGVEQKFKYAPAFFTLFQSYLYYLFLNKKINFSMVFIVTLSLLALAFSSNMRSVILAELIGVFLILIHGVTFSKQKKAILFTLLFLVVGGGVFSLSINFIELIGNERFSSQITAKGVQASELSNRLDGLLISFGFIESKYQTFLGAGGGSAFDYGLWGGGDLNPADSGFFHMLLSGGSLLLASYIFLLFALLVTAIKNIFDFRNFLSISIFSSLLISVLNNFNDSPFLNMSDTFIFAIISGWVLGFRFYNLEE